MTKFYHEDLTLQQVVERSNFIAIVRQAEPESSIQKKRTSIWPWKPAFEVFFDHYEVIEVIQKPYEMKVPSGVIKVRMANYSTRLRVHRLYHNKRIRKHPIYDRYTPLFKGSGDGRMILFCFVDGRAIQYVAQKSVEGLSARDRVEQILSSDQLPDE